MKIHIKTDKIRQRGETILKGVSDFRIETLSRLSRKTQLGIGAGAVALVLIGSIFAFAGPFGTQAVDPDTAVLSAAVNAPEGYEILVNGARVATLETEADANAVLNGVTDYYLTDGAKVVKVAYEEQVQVAPAQTTDAAILAVADAINLIVTGNKEPKTYTIQEGDNLWDISMSSDMSVEELIAANPQVNPDHLTIGTKLNLFEIKPYLHLSITEQVVAAESIEYPIQYEETNTLYKGEVQVKVAGSYGKREITKENVTENGALVSTTELSATVTSEPKTQIMLKGTKSLSSLVGTGSFVSPMGHLEISSAYGSRGGGRHTGVDLRNPKGTPIYVVDDGVVTFASREGTYGNLVRVSHGNGIETWYAHCDTMLVKVGDVVRKGEQIATVGATGRATGYHLHFEIRKNGVPQNPMNYL